MVPARRSRKEVSVAARSTVTMPRAEIGPRGAFTVETESPDVVVESGADGAGALAFGPCATNVGAHWYFAAGTTLRGVDQWLVVYNPLGTDAKIDLTLRTEAGAREPVEYQARDVARRSRLIVPIHELAGRRQRVAVEVRARVGLVIAQQTNIFGANSGLQGITQSLGALAPARETWFADGAPRPGIVVAIANAGPVDAQVEVRGYPDGDAIVAPVSITVPREGVSFVPVGGCAGTPDEECIAVPAGAPYALSVVAEGRTPVVAEVLERAPGTASRVPPSPPACRTRPERGCSPAPERPMEPGPPSRWSIRPRAKVASTSRSCTTESWNSHRHCKASRSHRRTALPSTSARSRGWTRSTARSSFARRYPSVRSARSTVRPT